MLVSLTIAASANTYALYKLGTPPVNAPASQFPLQTFHDGGWLLLRAIEPFRAGDTVTFRGEVTAKRQSPPSVLPYQGGKNGGVVECRVKGTNQRGDLVCLSEAALVLPG